MWWNGRRVGLKIRCWWQRVGSSPTTSTKRAQVVVACVFLFVENPTIVVGFRGGLPTNKHTHVCKDTIENVCFGVSWIFELQKQCNNIPKIREFEIQVPKWSVMMLKESSWHSRQEYEKDKRIHSEPTWRRQANGANDDIWDKNDPFAKDKSVR